MRYNRIFTRIAVLLLGGLFSASCIYDHIDDEIPEEVESPFTNGYSLNVMLSLDNLGGTRAETPNMLREFENYIDPEKCRVLFFDYEEKFLFESKSRWIKQLAPGANGEQWMVSIPMYPYGNDVDENWEWDQIRKSLQEHPFKIAILANRPALELYPDLEHDPQYEDRKESEYKTFDNSFPLWGVEDTRFGGIDGSENKDCKTIFSLHHTHHDPIYTDKGTPTQNNVKWNGDNFYAPFMGDGQSMGATSSWVDFGEAMDDNGDCETFKDSKNQDTKRRYAKRADKNYPIPMYGVQEFNKIENWIEGVPFNLSRLTTGTENEQGGYEYKSVSLLRSVVKLELIFPKYFNNGNNENNKINLDLIQLGYPNIYARSEPMDVWTPTDQLWKAGHDVNEDCEWFTLKKYARLVEGGRTNAFTTTGTLENNQGKVNNPTAQQTTNNTYNLYAYRRRLSWFYGAWLEKGWPFDGVRDTNTGDYTNGHTKGSDVVQAIVDQRRQSKDEPPRIFNPCIQRNNRVMCYRKDYGKKDLFYTGFSDDANYYHVVVYMGERNSIDPSALYKIDATGGYSPTVCTWYVGLEHPERRNGGTGYTYYWYSFPIADYSAGNPVRDINGGFDKNDTTTSSDPNRSPNKTFTYSPGNEPGNSDFLQSYADNMVTQPNTDLIPWPLMRNHHYVIKIGALTRAPGAEDGFGFAVSSQVNYSETLDPSPLPATPADKDRK